MANSTPERPTPKPLYPCAMPGCGIERSWPAEDLAWYSGHPRSEDEDCIIHAVEAGWYCDLCAGGESAFGEYYSGPEFDCEGPTLAEYLNRSHPSSEEPAPAWAEICGSQGVGLTCNRPPAHDGLHVAFMATGVLDGASPRIAGRWLS